MEKSKIYSLIPKLELPSNNRFSWVEIGEAKVFLDAYNANPDSMESSLKYFISKASNASPKSILYILGDMNELGDLSEELHGDISRLVESCPEGRVCFVGKYKDFYSKHSLEKVNLMTQWKS